jgi:hypothetical protein
MSPQAKEQLLARLNLRLKQQQHNYVGTHRKNIAIGELLNVLNASTLFSQTDMLTLEALEAIAVSTFHMADEMRLLRLTRRQRNTDA